MSAPVQVLLADDHGLIRGMLEDRLQSSGEFAVVAGVADGSQALAQAIRLRPDLVVLDIDMPGLNSFEAARGIRRHCPDARVVFLSAFHHDRYIQEAIEVEASGYITKTEPPSAVLAAIRAISRGSAYFSPEVEARLVIESDGPRLAEGCHTKVSTLTERETEILRYLAQGKSKKEIAQVMNLSERTVNSHAASLMAKLDIHDRVALARYAIREGLAPA